MHGGVEEGPAAPGCEKAKGREVLRKAKGARPELESRLTLEDQPGPVHEESLARDLTSARSGVPVSEFLHAVEEPEGGDGVRVIGVRGIDQPDRLLKICPRLVKAVRFAECAAPPEEQRALRVPVGFGSRVVLNFRQGGLIEEFEPLFVPAGLEKSVDQGGDDDARVLSVLCRLLFALGQRLSFVLPEAFVADDLMVQHVGEQAFLCRSLLHALDQLQSGIHFFFEFLVELPAVEGIIPIQYSELLLDLLFQQCDVVFLLLFSVHIGKILSELFPRVVDSAFHRILVYTQPGGDLPHPHSPEIEQFRRGAPFFRETSERLRHPPVVFPVEQEIEGGRLGGGQEVREGVDIFVVPPGCESARGLAPGDRPEPRREAVRVGKRFQIQKRVDEGLLYGVLGVEAVPAQPEAQAVDPSGVLFHEPPEGFPVARLRPEHGFPLFHVLPSFRSSFAFLQLHHIVAISAQKVCSPAGKNRKTNRFRLFSSDYIMGRPSRQVPGASFFNSVDKCGKIVYNRSRRSPCERKLS